VRPHGHLDQIQPTTQNINMTARLTVALAQDWQADIEGGWFQSQSQQITNQTAPRPLLCKA